MIPIFYKPAYVGSGYSFDTTRKAAWIAESLPWGFSPAEVPSF